MKFVTLKLNRINSMGIMSTDELQINADNITYIDLQGDVYKFKLIGDPTVFTVSDDNSKQTLRTISGK